MLGGWRGTGCAKKRLNVDRFPESGRNARLGSSNRLRGIGAGGRQQSSQPRLAAISTSAAINRCGNRSLTLSLCVYRARRYTSVCRFGRP